MTQWKKIVRFAAIFIIALIVLILITIIISSLTGGFFCLIPPFGFYKIKEMEIYNDSSPEQNKYFERQIQIEYFLTEKGFFKNRILSQSIRFSNGKFQVLEQHFQYDCVSPMSSSPIPPVTDRMWWEQQQQYERIMHPMTPVQPEIYRRSF